MASAVVLDVRRTDRQPDDWFPACLMRCCSRGFAILEPNPRG
jgi:hypothetical protein